MNRQGNTYVKQTQQIVYHTDTLPDPSDNAQRFKPVQEMVSQKAVNKIAVLYLPAALLAVVDPVSTGILDLRREGSVDSLPVKLRPERSGKTQAANVSLESVGG